ncbi:DNA gyrase subunit A [Actinomyces sp. HMSC065F12]|uniref:DNA gyrase subunit A n=1 Tax=Actinomyces sp. HMSC065F12 TaxID=1739479 RepID=UPI0008A3FEE1|nr:DNA gyrase subunit A [Actinomyces sp. HMSC065F12]OFP68505.1 DNA gyrase subunit A [Actinomyces sp. HMSC065F12]
MSDEPTTEIESTAPHGRIDQVDLEMEMKRSYLDYAMSVIVGRALPDVRDGLKPVHRRILYAMYDGGYRPNAGFYKCMRVVGDVLAHYHPHGDSSVYGALARLIQPWSMRYPLIAGQGNFGSPGNLGPAAPRYTECKMAPLAMEMVRDIDEDTVDFQDNYDGRTQEPTILPSRIPNLLINGSEGIAVGMATRIPPHNLREVAEGVQWALEHPDATREELLAALMERIKGPDFPSGATILGRKGIEDAYRTGRGSIIQRAIVEVEEIHGRTCLVVKALPYQVNPDNLVQKIADMVKAGQIQGIADIRDETSGRSGTRLIMVLKRDAVAKVVLNNLYKRTQLQDSFPANMLALVDGVPRTLSLDGFIRHWIRHQIEVIERRTRFRLNKARERLHILEGYLKALDALDEVIALIRRSPTADDARTGLMDLLNIDEAQSDAILALQLRRLAALERQKILDEHAQLRDHVADLEDILATPQRQRDIVSTELAEIVERYGDERVTTIVPYAGEMSMEDLIPEEDVVVTITRDGFAKRTRTDNYRSQKRGGKGVRGTQLKGDDVVEHFFVTTTHQWLLFFTNLGRVYRAKAYEIPEGGRTSRGQHVANLLAFQPDERIAQVLAIHDYDEADYLVLATRSGLVKKTRLSEYDSARTGGIIAINLRDDDNGEPDQQVSAQLVNADDDLILVSRKGQAVRFTASDEQLRPMGRGTSGVRGMKFRDGDELLAMEVVREGADLLIVTDGGYAKRTPLSEYPVKGRGIFGVRVGNLVDERGALVGALVVDSDENVMVITESGKLVQINASDVRATGRNTMGVIFARPDDDDRIIAITRHTEDDEDEAVDETADESAAQEADEPVASSAETEEDEQ